MINIFKALKPKTPTQSSSAPKDIPTNSTETNQAQTQSIDNYFKTSFKSQDNYVIANNPSSFPQLLATVMGTAKICNDRNSAAISTTEFKLYAVKGTKDIAKWVKQSELSKKELNFIKESSRDNLIKKAQTIVEIENHPIIDLLFKQPNEYMSNVDLFAMTENYLGSIGNAFWKLERSKNGGIESIWCLLSENVKVVIENNKIVGYVYKPYDKEYIYKPEDVIHFKNMTAGDIVYGRGSQISCYLDSTLEQYINLYNVALAKNNGRPDYIIKYDGRLSEKDNKELNNMVSSKYSGVNSAGKVMITDSGFDIINLGWAPKDMSFQQAQTILSSKISKAYGVPESLLSIQDSNYASSRSALLYYNKYTILPKLIRLVEAINKKIVSEIDPNLFVWFKNPIDEDVEFELKEKDFELRKEAQDVALGIRSAEQIIEDRKNKENK